MLSDVVEEPSFHKAVVEAEALQATLTLTLYPYKAVVEAEALPILFKLSSTQGSQDAEVRSLCLH